MTSLLQLFEGKALQAIDLHIARALQRLVPDTDPLVLLGASAVSRALREGHTCLDLSIQGGQPILLDGGTEVHWPAYETWSQQLKASEHVGQPGDFKPLILVGDRFLYFHRYLEHERAVAGRILELAGRPQLFAGEVLDGSRTASMVASLDRHFPGAREGALEEDHRARWQAIAAVIGVLNSLCIITGGPGTGKTSTVLKLLAVILEQSSPAERPPRILLLAPTGKAAMRLQETIGRQLPHLTLKNSDLKEALPSKVQTIHRALGSTQQAARRFRHNADNPLAADIVVVDEASMIDLGLMRSLLDALPPQARLILVGDPDQLTSVEAGCVLRHICDNKHLNRFSSALSTTLRALLNTIPEGLLESDEGEACELSDCIVQLQGGRRFEADSGIAQLAQAIKGGDPDRARAILSQGETNVSLTSSEQLDELISKGFAAFSQEASPQQTLANLGQFRILCAHRAGPAGVYTLNRRAENTLKQTNSLQPGWGHYHLRPILITTNDYNLQIFNGTTGLVTKHRGDLHHSALFPGANGAQARSIPTNLLPEHETAFAITIHKSQGSEFDEVVIVLPGTDSPLLSRDLLYTAVTRARRRVTLVGEFASLKAAILRPVNRFSGLRHLLWPRS